jgi:chromosome segregation ATPase
MTASDIQQEIDRTRERLGETVEELAAKADVKARASKKAADVRARAAEAATELSGRAAELSGRARKSQVLRRRWPVAAAAGALIVGSVIIWRRQRG